MLKKAMLAALAVTTLAGPVLAQDHERGRDWHQGGGDWHQGGDRGDHRGWDGGRGGWRGNWGDFRHDDRRWDQPRFRWNGYAYPRGYGYRSWVIGAPVDRVFWGPRFWIGNWAAYRLEAPYPGTRWIRVGPDALLIRIYDGFVVRAVRGIYY